MKIFISITLLLSLFIVGCKHHPDEVIDGVPPSELVYSPSHIEVLVGNDANSVEPTYKGDSTISFSIQTTPLTSPSDVFIDAQGVIHIKSGLSVGSYAVSVVMNNDYGTATFPDAFTFDVIQTANPPSNLIYTPNSVTLNDGELASSVIPTVSGTMPMTFELISTPLNADIVIGSDGVITVVDTIPVGTYSFDVVVKNPADTVTFSNAYSITVVEVAPFNMQYSPDNISVAGPNTGASVVPTIEGTLPITYQVTSVPTTSDITIDAQGVINVAAGLNIGTYDVSVEATNTAGTTVFTDIFQVEKTPTASAPSNLVYSTDVLNLNQGSAGNSVTPTIQGTTPITYSLTSNPSSSEISINANTGVISVSNSATPGSYSINVDATNSVGTTNFTSVYTVNVTGATLPSNLVYNPNSISIVEGNTGASVTPSIQGTTPISYTLTSSPSNAGITIDGSTGVISINSSVTAGTYDITVSASNAAGSEDFTSIYSVEVTAPTAVSYANDIKPIIQNKCNNCHTSGPQTIYTNYNNASTDANIIYDRVTRTPGSVGFMPKNQPALSQAEQDLILQWINGGKQP